jgi:hypothetical protein
VTFLAKKPEQQTAGGLLMTEGTTPYVDLDLSPRELNSHTKFSQLAFGA